MATTLPYPTTPQDMLDRLLADREFLIRTIVNDNYPAVREQFEEQLQSHQPQLINTPEKLADQLIWWDRAQGRETVDPVINVPFRNATGSQVLSQAMTLGREMMEQSGGAKLFDVGAVVGGLSGIVNGVAGILNGRAQIAANERMQSELLRAQAEQQRLAAAQRDKFLKWASYAGGAILLVVLIWILKR